MPERLILEIEVPDFNTEGIAETLATESEPDAPYSVYDYLFDADVMTGEVALGIGVPGFGVTAQSGRIIGARLSNSKGPLDGE